MPRSSRRIAALGLAATVLMVTKAAAVERKGFIIGFAVGGGQMSCDRCDSLSGAAAEIHLGGMVTPRIALEFDTSLVDHTESGSDSTLYSEVFVGALRFWPTSRVWLKGGAGGGRLEHEDRFLHVDARSDTAFALTAAAGVELLQRRKFVLDLQGRFATVGYKEGRINNASRSWDSTGIERDGDDAVSLRS